VQLKLSKQFTDSFFGGAENQQSDAFAGALCRYRQKEDMGSHHESREQGKVSARSKSALGVAPASGRSDTGCERESNEDRFLIFNRDDMAGYFVFDGMGGQPAGETAAQISVDVIQNALSVFEEGDLAKCMSDVIELAQEEILSRGKDSESAGMGTTVVGVLNRGNEVVVGAVGDSRAYHIKAGSVTQITSDHTLVQQLVDAGQISAYDALVHPQSHILTRCLGSRLAFSIDIKRCHLEVLSVETDPQEWLLLCSDGLYSLVSDEEIGAIVLNYQADEATKKLISIARLRGGFDNITAIVIPLCGRLIEPSTNSGDELGQQNTPTGPEELLNGTEFTELVTREGHPSCPFRRIGFVTVVSALILIVTVVWLALFTKR
jgi:serine/threonine protein phosphatase PrpC